MSAEVILWSTCVNCILPIEEFIKVGRVFIRLFYSYISYCAVLKGNKLRCRKTIEQPVILKDCGCKQLENLLKTGKQDYAVIRNFIYPLELITMFIIHTWSAHLDACSGLNLARMLGDKFLKQQEARFSSEPYISQVVCMNSESRDFAIMAR